MNIIPAGWSYEQSFWQSGKQYVAGIDEVGRGAWAGPVVAGAVIFPPFIKFPQDLYDSKMLKPREREKLSKLIFSQAISVGIGLVEVPIINRSGIGKATQRAFRQAVRNLDVNPEQILIDAFYINHLNRETQLPIKKGDQVSASIAAASIVAKVYRDKIMRILAREFPVYRWGVNKGYGTAAHQQAIREYKLSKLHRTSFDLSYLL